MVAIHKQLQGKLNRAQEQLRFSALNVDPPSVAHFGDTRFHGKNRREWMIEVDGYTHVHREYEAAVHEFRAWYELQPRHEPVLKRPIRRPQPRVEISYCSCEDNKVVVDIFGPDKEQHFELFHGLKRCTLPGCGKILEPLNDHGWHVYANAMLERTAQKWCTCEHWAIEKNRKGMKWCVECHHPMAPHPINDSPAECARAYRAVVEAFYSGAVMRLVRQLERQAAEKAEHWNETGYELGQGPDEQQAVLEELAQAIGLDAPGDAIPKPHGPGTSAAPDGSVTGWKWHTARAKGQREKLDRTLQCGSEVMKRQCAACGIPGPTGELRCDNHRLCLGCRDKRAGTFQRRFAKAQKERLQRLWADPLKLKLTHYYEDPFTGQKRMRYGGAWGEKFLTLTLPHAGNPKQNVKEIQKAMPKFLRALREHIAKDLLGDDPKEIRNHLLENHYTYCRVLEVTPGNDWLGHAHVHMWFIAPFIHHDMIRHLWGNALSRVYQLELVRAECVSTVDEIVDAMPVARAWDGERLRSFLKTRRGKNGRPLAAVWRPVVDVQQVKSGDIPSELCKYLIKDGEKNKKGEVELLDPKLYAQIYAALERVRAICTARRLLEPVATNCFCQHCGGVYRRWIEPAPNLPQPTGPPSAQLELPMPSEP